MNPSPMIQIDDRRFNRLALIGIVLGFTLLIAGLGAVVTSFNASENSSRLVRHTYNVVDQLALLNVQLERAESGRRAYLLAPNGYRYRTYRENVSRAPRTLDRIAGLTSDNPAQVDNIPELRKQLSLQLTDMLIRCPSDLASSVDAGAS